MKKTKEIISEFEEIVEGEEMKDFEVSIEGDDITVEENDRSLYASYTRLIKLTSPQMYGEDIKDVQRRLNNLGYDAGTVDGYYGPKGVEAVKDFQGVNGLTVDGSVGPATWNKLFSNTAKPKPSSNNSGYTRLLYLTSPQMYGDDVKKVQNRLNTLGHNSGTADGYFGQNTKDAVKRFQKAEGLTIDGSVGPATWNKLFSEFRYSYQSVSHSGLKFHVLKTRLDNIETETILRPVANTSYTGINGGFFDDTSGNYSKPPSSGSSICYNFEDVGKYVTVNGVKRIANFHENQNNNKPVLQRSLIIYRSGGTVKSAIKKLTHVKEAFNLYGESNILNVIGGISPNITTGSASLPLKKAAISVAGSYAYLIYCPAASQVSFNVAIDAGLGLGAGINVANTVMLDGSNSACLKVGSQYYGSSTEKRYIYNMIRVR